ncbi:hypothetical protein [Sphingobacterium sp. MYb382]|uniref:hypothetical protein n=1 Tax=Sphingobacterium sp. MYb382 TaxID=2745278 RepID=UPI0030949C9B
MKNNFWQGLALGLIAPLLAFLLERYSGLVEALLGEKRLGIYFVSVILNLLIVRFFYRSNPQKDRLAKGVMLITFVAMLVLLYIHKIDGLHV